MPLLLGFMRQAPQAGLTGSYGGPPTVLLEAETPHGLLAQGSGRPW